MSTPLPGIIGEVGDRREAESSEYEKGLFIGLSRDDIRIMIAPRTFARRSPMTKTLTATLLIALAAAPTVAAAQTPDAPAAAIVTGAVENMHRHSTDDSDVVSQAILGTNVKLLRKERNADGEDWYEVETPDTYKGWILGSALELLKPGAKPYASSGKVFVVTALLANTYREPSVTKHKPVKTVPISAVLEIVGEQDERWLETRLPCGAKVWIQRGDGEVREAPWTWPRRKAEEMVALSKRFIGLPYTWGGTSPLGLDCSGFVQLVFRMSGDPLLRDAYMMYAQADLVVVPSGEEKAGDLVFFGGPKDDPKPTHVGMMIDGEYFINATTHETPTVRIDRLKDEYWQKIYRGVRRPK
jgi:cell wall-associated NlpC family hydrolase